MPEKWHQRTAVDYVDGWNDLLPTGPAWPRDPGSVLQLVVNGMSTIWGTEVEALAGLFLKTESDPRSTSILLPEWERAWGLPDTCIPSSPTDVPTREVNLVAKMTFLGSQSRQFFIQQAAKVGQTLNIQEFSPYQCGISGVGDTTNIEDDGTHVHYRWGLGSYTMRFMWISQITALTATFSGADLFCIFNRWKPAHTIVTFDYFILQELNFFRAWNSGYLGFL